MAVVVIVSYLPSMVDPLIFDDHEIRAAGTWPRSQIVVAPTNRRQVIQKHRVPSVTDHEAGWGWYYMYSALLGLRMQIPQSFGSFGGHPRICGAVKSTH